MAAPWRSEIEAVPWDEVPRLQEPRLRDQLAYVAARSPFYERKWAEAGFRPERVRTVADVAHAPFTTKEELRDSQTECPPLGWHQAAPLRDVIRIHSSSGTTGRPSYIGITRADNEGWIDTVARAYWCEGVRRDDVVIHAFGLGFFVGGLPLKDAIEDIGATFVPIGTGASDRVVTSIRNLGGTVLTCTPSYAQYLAEHVRTVFEMDPADLGLRRVMVGAEPGGGVPAVRDRIAGDFGAEVTEGMGNADLIPVYLASCDAGDGMHVVAPDQLLLELVDQETLEPLEWTDGAEGELVATHLGRECVPLVRFRTRDRIVVNAKPCVCGRGGPRIACVGRTDDMLIVAGVNVWPSAISDLVCGLRPRTTGAFQILLAERGPKVAPPLRLQVEYGDEATDLGSLRRQIETLIRDRLVVRADVELVPPSTLERWEMKAQLVRTLSPTPSVAGGAA
ncbi:MAG: phenylacetate-CoA ligase [Solirubrobacteraceae bacterium]|jgi:phenylacetate-CoA ligase|nr:phenylacetate-CoA ligase [Solirubrobacteraceae bacterium]MEA2394962.1 phenylacetate-CoA ligase [Solirubrobacteraceae bacterium]